MASETKDFRIVGWGPFRLPGEKRRKEQAFQKAKDILEAQKSWRNSHTVAGTASNDDSGELVMPLPIPPAPPSPVRRRRRGRGAGSPGTTVATAEQSAARRRRRQLRYERIPDDALLDVVEEITSSWSGIGRKLEINLNTLMYPMRIGPLRELGAWGLSKFFEHVDRMLEEIRSDLEIAHGEIGPLFRVYRDRRTETSPVLLVKINHAVSSLHRVEVMVEQLTSLFELLEDEFAEIDPLTEEAYGALQSRLDEIWSWFRDSKNRPIPKATTIP